ncbi:MAG: capsule assembly Wzi family protein [Gammaproteobacteria bacterium]|nr:capsule assembly Wzi family protein [Gammaproteobacteria bacterium]
MRLDIELLTDAGLLNIPITTWPLSWGDLSEALTLAAKQTKLSPALTLAVQRLQHRARREVNWGIPQSEYTLALADNPLVQRGFRDSSRGNGELNAAWSYLGERFSARIEVALVANPDDERNVTMDGSYVGMAIGNTTVSLGFQDKWWGPGLESTLALSTNARPIPGVLVKRNYSNPFEHPWLRWIGPWTASFFIGEMESDRVVADARFIGGRIAFRPLPSLELGLTRTAQWGGQGRDDSLDSFFDLLLGRDNVGDGGITAANEPGNQMAGYDWRWRVIRGRFPVVFYGQLIGEDEAGGFPSRFLGQLGVTMTAPVAEYGASVRTHVEFSDTTCQFYEASKLFDCAYQHPSYPSGYRFRGRSIGHSTDNDSRQIALGASFVSETGRYYSATLRIAELNRGSMPANIPDPAHSLTSVPADFWAIDISHERPFYGGDVTLGVGYSKMEFAQGAPDRSEPRLILEWKNSF